MDAENNKMAMTPIVFWASLPPWVRLKSAEENNCSPLKSVWEDSSGTFFCNAVNKKATIKAITKPIKGEKKIPKKTLIKPDGISAAVPPLIMAPPAKPPMRAWEELEGRPKYHVIRFQEMAPIKAAKISLGSTILV